jgi:hypothetical protein
MLTMVNFKVRRARARMFFCFKLLLLLLLLLLNAPLQRKKGPQRIAY